LIPKIIFAAQSGTGKTTLLARLITYLSTLHVSTGYIKHHHGAIKSGKDSHIIKEAGSSRSILIADNTLLIEDPVPIMSQNSPEFLEFIVETYFKSMDLILIEGFKNNLTLPKVLIFRDGSGDKKWFFKQKNDKNIIAAVSDTLFSNTSPYPVFKFEDLKKLAEFICGYFKILPDDKEKT